MLSYHLKSALYDLDMLVEMTGSDIDDIRAAKQEPQFARLSLKEEKIRSFESKKAMIDHEISKLMTLNPEKGLENLLSEEQHLQLESLRAKLEALSEINKKYAKMVLTVSAFYNSLLERLVPTEMDGYNAVASKNSASFLEIRA